jgi:hypothetical protein
LLQQRRQARLGEGRVERHEDLAGFQQAHPRSDRGDILLHQDRDRLVALASPIEDRMGDAVGAAIQRLVAQVRGIAANRQSSRMLTHDRFEALRDRLFGRLERERFERAARMSASGSKLSLTKWELGSRKTRAGASGDAVGLDHLVVLTYEAYPRRKSYTTESSGGRLDTRELRVEGGDATRHNRISDSANVCSETMNLLITSG